MKLEQASVEASPEDDSGEEHTAEQRKIGPLSDYAEEGGPAYYPPDMSAFLKQVEAARDPNEKIDVSAERERLGERLQTVSSLLAKERENEGALSRVRGELGMSAAPAETVEKLEAAKASLEEQGEELNLAEKYNDVLNSFSMLSREELEHIKQTGKRKDGHTVRTRGGEELGGEVVKHLAHLASSGMLRMTWGELEVLSEVVDAILHDVVGAVKGVLGIGGNERPKPS